MGSAGTRQAPPAAALCLRPTASLPGLTFLPAARVCRVLRPPGPNTRSCFHQECPLLFLLLARLTLLIPLQSRRARLWGFFHRASWVHLPCVPSPCCVCRFCVLSGYPVACVSHKTGSPLEQRPLVSCQLHVLCVGAVLPNKECGTIWPCAWAVLIPAGLQFLKS